MHLYDKQGQPMYEVPYANPKKGMRATTLRDARKQGWIPSVTTVIGILDKPGLNFWKQTKVLESALSLKQGKESDDVFMARIRQAAKEKSTKAAEEGTRIHDALEKAFNGEKVPIHYLHITNKVTSDVYNYFGVTKGWVAEASFGHKDGYGGKVDLSNKLINVVLDFKTKEQFKRSKAGVITRMAYDEHCMQLHAYGKGLGFKNPNLYNLFVEYSGETCFHPWNKGEIERGAEMFDLCLKLWMLIKNYNCSWEEEWI